MTKTTSMARTGLLAVLLAMVGFSYSLATSNTDSDVAEVGARAVGTTVPLQFVNPFVQNSTDRDLGDAVAGSALTRLVRAKGGVAPYTFTAAGSAVNGANAATTLAAAQLQVLANGVVTQVGTQTAKTIPAGAFRFQVTVKDSSGTNPNSKTETFRLTFVTTTQFRFAVSTLPDGVQFQSYSAQVPTINGKGPITYAVSGTGLNNTGLTLASDGTLFGVPTVATATFFATAKDANNKTAASQAGTGVSQQYTVNFAANKTLSSSIVATSITIKTGAAGKDGVAYKGVANLGAASISSLSGQPLTIRIGNYVSSAVAFDGNGSANTAKGLVPAVKASVKKFGVTAITTTKETINLGINPTGSTVQLPVEVRIGNVVMSTEVLTFDIKAGTQSTLTYKGGVSGDVGGSAQLLKVQGADDKGNTGDAWKVTFLGRFPAAANVGTSTSATVSIGQNYKNTISLTSKNGKLTGKGSSKSPVVSAFSLDTSKNGKGSYTTGVLAKSGTLGTLIPLASAPGTAQAFFTTNVTFSGGAGFDGSLAIFAKKTKWSSQ